MRASTYLAFSPETSDPRNRLFEALKVSMTVLDVRDLEEQGLNVRAAFQNFLDLLDVLLPEELEDPGRVLDLMEPSFRNFELELADRGLSKTMVNHVIDEVQIRVYLAFSKNLISTARREIPNYLEKAQRRPNLPPDHEMALIHGLQERETSTHLEGKELLFYQYVNFIRVLAFRFIRHYPEMLQVEDLIEDGLSEFLSILDRHKPEFGLVSTFIRQQIGGRLNRAAHLYMDTVTLPERKRKAVRSLVQGHWKLASQLMREPSWEEVANFLGWPLDRVHVVRGWARISDSLRFDGPEVRERPTFEHGMIPANAEVHAQLHELRTHLTPREDEILIRMDLFGESSEDVALDFGLTGARIRQIRRDIFAKLRALLKEEGENG